MFIDVAYADGIDQYHCYPLTDVRLVDYVAVAWNQKRPDGIPFMQYSVFHHQSGAVFTTFKDSPEEAIAEALSLIDEKGPELIAGHIAAAMARKSAWESRYESGRGEVISKQPDRAGRIGAVYFIRSAGKYKIGQSINPDQRISGMTLPEKPDVLVIHRTPKYKEAERELHLRFAHKRGHGEWFDFDNADIPEVEQAIRSF